VRELEARGCAFAAFAAGPVGSHRPHGPGSGAGRAEAIARELAARIVAAAERAEVRPIGALGSARATLPLPGLQFRVTRNWRLSPLLTSTQHDDSTDVQAVRIDGHLWVAFGFELSGMISGPLKDEAVRAGWTLHLTPFNGDYVGYVVPDELYDSGEYEAMMMFAGPHAEGYVRRVVGAIVRGAGR